MLLIQKEKQKHSASPTTFRAPPLLPTLHAKHFLLPPFITSMLSRNARVHRIVDNCRVPTCCAPRLMPASEIKTNTRSKITNSTTMLSVVLEDKKGNLILTQCEQRFRQL
jgi:hypothetical protein